MSQNIIRIINEKGKLVSGVAAPSLSKEELVRLYRGMVLSRSMDKRMTMLQRQGRIGFFVGSTGEEAAIVASAFALSGKDWIVPCYREAGAALLRGYPMRDFVCQIYGNSDDKMKGRQMPCHWGSPELRITTVSSPVGTQIPHATGIAMAAKIQKKQEVALTYFGDGATSTGDFHVGCNFAGVYKAPVIFLCRNNRWAISVPFKYQTAADDIASKAEGYGIKGVQVDGNDALAVFQVTRDARDRALKGEGPTLIEAVTYRQGAHSTSDDPRAYREESEVDEWKAKDPIARFRHFLIDQKVWSEKQDEALKQDLKDEILAAIDEAEKLGPPDRDTMVEDVFDSVPWHLEEQRTIVRRAVSEELE